MSGVPTGARDRAENHTPHVPGHQWGFTVLERIHDAACPPTDANPKADPEECRFIFPGTLRVESLCPACERSRLLRGGARGEFEGVAFGGEVPSEREFGGTWVEWAEVVNRARGDWWWRIQRDLRGSRW